MISRWSALTDTHQTTESTGSEDDILGSLPVWTNRRFSLVDLGLQICSSVKLDAHETTTYHGLPLHPPLLLFPSLT